MAAGSTDSFTATSQSLACFNSDLLKTAQEKFWTSAEVVATACTGGFWEDDPEEKIKKQINALKRKFHSGRQLLIKYLPRDVTEEDVRELLADFPVQMVALQTGAGSGSARVTLEDPEMLEDWDRERVFVLRGQRVPVVPAPTEMMLCVARLPPAFTEPQFAALVRSYGEVRRSFLMLSERTGASKGYGFVEYTMKETAMQAKSLLDGRQLDGCTLCCDWLDSNHVTFESLHSKCLYVDRLPPNFRDMGEFRKVFSSIVNPPYCQIALRNGCPQDWGLVEFSSADDAELTRTAVDSVQLRGHSIRTSFYIPGVRAINLYLKLLNDSGNKSKGALLPDPPAPAVFQQLQNLAKQNPIFAQNLQNIILSQIQNLPQKSEPNVKTNVSPNSCASSTSSVSSVSSTSSAASISIPPPPPLPRKTSQGVPPPALPTGKPSPNSTNGGNSQAALVVLLAAQMQMQMGNNNPPSLLGNPQMLATLQNLLKQGPNSGGVHPPFPQNHFPQQPPPQVPNHEKMQPNKNGMNGMKNGYHKPSALPKVPLLPSPTTGVSPPPREVSPIDSHLTAPPNDAAALSNLWNGLLGGQMLPNLSPQTMEQMLGPKATLQDKLGYPSKPAEIYTTIPQAPTELQHNLNLLLNNPHNLNALLGNLMPTAFVAPPPQQRHQTPSPAEAAWGLPPSPPPPPAAWVPPMGSPLRPWAPGSFPCTPSTSPIVFAGCPGLWTTAAHPHAPVTPVGQKRKYNHILPSPEPSPEGNYIGQHSQGIGGHYADSYFKRKKKH